MRIPLCIALLGTLLLSHQLPAQDRAKPLTNEDVIKMVKSGMDEEVVKTIVQRAPAANFDTSPNALILLKNAGVPAKVMSAMVTGPAPTSIAAPLAAGPISDKVEEPEYADSAFLLDSNGSLKPLERQTPNQHTTSREISLVVNGAKSPMRVLADQKPEFVIRLGTGDVDPSTLIEFFSLTTNKDNRELKVVKIGITGRRTKGANEKSVLFSIVKYGKYSFKITPNGSLAPGEYVISTTTSKQGYCFGVD